jgi:hypothetical protein
MSVDIVEGDVLVVDGKDYPIRSVAEWAGFPQGSIAFKRMARVTASTKRSPALSGTGTRGAPVAHLSAVKCTPLDPVDPELRSRLKLNTPHELLETYLDSDPYLKLILEDLRL